MISDDSPDAGVRNDFRYRFRLFLQFGEFDCRVEFDLIHANFSGFRFSHLSPGQESTSCFPMKPGSGTDSVIPMTIKSAGKYVSLFS